MQNETVTIQEAINRGNSLMGYQLWILIAASPVIAIILASAGFFVSAFLAIPVCIILSVMYVAWIRPRWRIWAYSRVEDIHQFQRSGELAGLLVLHSHDKAGGLMGAQKRMVLKQLILRFENEQVFVDDSSVPAETQLCTGSMFGDSRPLFIFSDEGVTCTGQFLPWSEIRNERVAKVSSSRSPVGTTLRSSSSNTYYLRLETDYGQTEYLVSNLDRKPWMVDLLLYIYRGRYEAKKNTPLH